MLQSPRRRDFFRKTRPFALALALVFLAPASVPPAAACPFCGEPEPTLSQRRESAQIAALGEVSDVAGKPRRFRIHQVLKGAEMLQDPKLLAVPDASGPDLKPGALVLLLGRHASQGLADQSSWEYVPLNEVSYAYVARSPGLRKTAAERLAYFARYLEHREPLVANDAWLEFAHAPYDEVLRVAEHLPVESMCGWLLDAGIPPQRKGFYALAVGFATRPDQRRANAGLLLELIQEPASDFRSGFDGLLAGYLLLEGLPALELMERKYLDDPQAAQGDVRHALAALRFYRDWGKEIPPDRICAALRKGLGRPELAAEVIADLARCGDWEAMLLVVGLFDKAGYPQTATDRAIVGYLSACPDAGAKRQLDRLRKLSPRRIAAAEEALSVFSGSQRDS
ncbi:MAG: hypothetical protein WD847_16920 [Pirellulales bacterium]